MKPKLAERIVIATGCAVLLAVACDSPTRPTPDRISGEYELVSISGHSLPWDTFPLRVTAYQGHISLASDRQYVQTGRSQICGPDSCFMQNDTTRGTWLELYDGSLYFDNEDGYSWPPLHVTVDPTAITFCPDPAKDQCSPTEVYARQ